MDTSLPYVLWEERLPGGTHAKVIVCPAAVAVGLVLHQDGNLRRIEVFETRELAEEQGWALHKEVLAASGPWPGANTIGTYLA